MKIALDIGHLGKVNKPLDRGAVYDGTRESDFVLIYALSASQHLEKEGHCTYLLTYNDYGKRKQFCKDIGVELHLQLHLNSNDPPGDYSLVAYRKNNEKRSKKLALRIGKEFSNYLPVSKCIVNSLEDADRGYSCCMTSIPSLLVEPLFLNNEEHYGAMLEDDMLFTIGKTLACAIVDWIGGEKE